MDIRLWLSHIFEEETIRSTDVIFSFLYRDKKTGSFHTYSLNNIERCRIKNRHILQFHLLIKGAHFRHPYNRNLLKSCRNWLIQLICVIKGPPCSVCLHLIFSHQAVKLPVAWRSTSCHISSMISYIETSIAAKKQKCKQAWITHIFRCLTNAN